MFYLIGVQHDVQSISTDDVETTHHTEYRECLNGAKVLPIYSF
jgi:hypothetical protein